MHRFTGWILAALGLIACGQIGCGDSKANGAPDAGLPGVMVLISGTDENGLSVNAPEGWPAAAGAWNAKAAAFHPGSRKLVFETTRADILGGSVRPAGGLTAAGVNEYYVAGPNTGTFDAAGTSVLYVADADGASPRCIGCADVVDSCSDDPASPHLYRVGPPVTGSMPGTPQRLCGGAVYANQNKDLASWTPDGQWLIAGVEMPRHGLRHAWGCSEVGQFNDLWAISVDGLTWVQLTDFQSDWHYADPVGSVPYACAQTAQCVPGCQYNGAGVTVHSPYEAYSCSEVGAPPPAVGTMRPRVSHGDAGAAPGSAKVIWAERVGLSATYAWRGVQQLAEADLVFNQGLPALVGYARNLTPTPGNPEGRDLWNNPGGGTVIGTVYESFNFSGDDAWFAVASDAAYSTSPGASIGPFALSGLFPDVLGWSWNSAAPQLVDFTAYQPGVYAYEDNAGPTTPLPYDKYGHWEEPSVLSPSNAPVPYLAFASTADLDPAWNPLDQSTFGLETWVMRQDRSAPALRLTLRDTAGTSQRWWTYPTDVDPADQTLFLTSLVGTADSNSPGNLYRLTLPSF